MKGIALALAFWCGVLEAQALASAQLATFLKDFGRDQGAETYSGRVDDGNLSRDFFARQLAETKGRLARLRSIHRADLSLDESIDFRFVESILVGQELAQERMQFWKKDPTVYMLFRRIETAISRPGDPNAKAASVLRMLLAVPEQLENGKRNLEVYVPRFQELAVFMAESATSIFDDSVPKFAAHLTTQKAEIEKANSAAKLSLASYTSFLKQELPKKTKAGFAVGKETYDLMLHGQYMLPYDSESLYKFGWDQYNKTVAEMTAVAKKIDPHKTWQQLCSEIKNDYPDPVHEIEVHQDWVNKSAEHVKSKGLIPIPWKERVDVVPRAEFLRKTSYYGNFSRAQGPNKDGVLVGQWQINTFLPSWDEKTKKDYEVEHDWGVIIDTAPHETYGGHHVQSLYQMHNPDELRRTHGISIFSEGWGLYNEQLMQETGFFPNEKIHLRQLQLRLWRIARVIWDCGIHTGKMSYNDAVSLLSDKVGFLRWAAELEVDGSTQAPGYRLGYFMGYSEIMKIREEFKQRMGTRFTLRDFHERLLKVGNMPPALMREGLMARLSN